MLLDVANRKAGRRKFCGRRQARDTTANNENVQDLYLSMMPQAARVGAGSKDPALHLFRRLIISVLLSSM
jgi:hypothetical protein